MVQRVFPLKRQVRVVAMVVPVSHWYAAAECVSRAHGWVAQLASRNGRLTRALVLDYWLRELTLRGPFTIPWRIEDVSGLQHAEPGRAIFFCWTHVPLIEFALSTLVELGQQPLMVCDEGMMVDTNKFVAPGLADRMDAIPARTSSLRRVLASLRAGRSVAWLADPLLGGRISSQTLRLVALSGARLVFGWGERDGDGTIAIRMVDPPFPDCETPAAIEANLEVLRRERRRILRELGSIDEVGAPLAAQPHRRVPILREPFPHR